MKYEKIKKITIFCPVCKKQRSRLYFIGNTNNTACFSCCLEIENKKFNKEARQCQN